MLLYELLDVDKESSKDVSFLFACCRFYLPADSGEKVALCITTLLSQTMFFLLMSEIS